MSTTHKPINQKAWWFILPVLVCVAFSAILPLMTVVNYSVQDIISPERRVFVGTEWFSTVMRDEDLHSALWRQIQFSLSVLCIEIPLGIVLALAMPAQGWRASAALVLIALSLLIPWNVVGTIWQIYGRADIGLLGYTLSAMGIDYSYTNGTVLGGTGYIRVTVSPTEIKSEYIQTWLPAQETAAPTEKPAAVSFLTVSGVAATRVSLARVSFVTAMTAIGIPPP